MKPDQDEPTDDDMAVALDPNEPHETVIEHERRTGKKIKVPPGTPDEQGELEIPKEPPRPPMPPQPPGGEPPRPPPKPPPGNEPPRPPVPPQPPGGGEPPRPPPQPPGGGGGAARDNFIHGILALVDAYRRASGTVPPPGGGTERPRG